MANPWDDYKTTTVASAEPPPWQDFQKPAGAIDYSGPTADVRAAIAKLPPEQREQALREWADVFVANERKGGGIVQGVTDVARNLARGTPVGSWLDEANAAGSAAVNKVTGGALGAPYDETLAYQRATDRAIDADATKVGRLPVIGDVTTGGITKLAGGIASAPVSPMLRLAQGGGLLANAFNAGISGAGYGAMYGAGEGETASERMKGGALGLGVGGALGLATPIAARGVANAASYVADKFRPMPQPLRAYDKQSVQKLSTAATDDRLFDRYPQRSAELGPEGMLADMGPNMRSHLEAIAQRPGPGQYIAEDRLLTRRKGNPDAQLPGAADRIADDATAGLGPAVNVPKTVRELRKTANAEAKPYYDEFYSKTIKPTPELEATLRRVPEPAWEGAQRLAAMEGVDLERVINTGRGLDLIKRAMDDIAREAKPGSNLQRVASNIAKDLRDETDRILNPKDPLMSPWAQARRLSGEGLQFEEAAQMGQGAFRKGLTPDQMGEDLRRLGPYQQEAYRVGARDDVRTLMGNASTAFGPNADTAARAKLQSDFAREKLDMIALPGGADRINRRLKAETAFAETEQGVLRNSATARRQAAQDLYPKPDAAKDVGRSLRGMSLPGMAVEGAYKIGNILRSGNNSANAERIARDSALMLTEQGVTRDQIARALMTYGQQRNVSQKQRDSIDRIVSVLMQGSRAPAIDNQLSSDQRR